MEAIKKIVEEGDYEHIYASCRYEVRGGDGNPVDDSSAQGTEWMYALKEVQVYASNEALDWKTGYQTQTSAMLRIGSPVVIRELAGVHWTDLREDRNFLEQSGGYFIPVRRCKEKVEDDVLVYLEYTNKKRNKGEEKLLEAIKEGVKEHTHIHVSFRFTVQDQDKNPVQDATAETADLDTWKYALKEVDVRGGDHVVKEAMEVNSQITSMKRICDKMVIGKPIYMKLSEFRKQMDFLFGSAVKFYPFMRGVGEKRRRMVEKVGNEALLFFGTPMHLAKSP